MRPADEGLCAMKKRQAKKQISKHEKARRAEQRAEQRRQAIAAVPKLLHARREAAHMLGGVSVASLIRLEKSGRLHPVKLDDSKRTGMTYYAHSELEELASGNAADPPLHTAEGHHQFQTAGGDDA
jgi:hypothetical protein